MNKSRQLPTLQQPTPAPAAPENPSALGWRRGIHRSHQAAQDGSRVHRGTAAARHRRVADRDESRWPVPYWYIDTGFTALLILLAVVNEGLGAVFFGIQPGIMADFRTRFGVPAEWTPIGAIAIGYPDPAADPVPPARASDRKSLDELVHRGHW
jgi:nitroreductase